MKNKFKFLTFLIVVVIFSTSCANVTNVNECLPENEPAGFWGGLWNGFTLFFSFIGSLFDRDIALWEVNNNGGWYNFGFMLGSGALGSVIRVTRNEK